MGDNPGSGIRRAMFAILALLAYTVALMMPAILQEGSAPMLGHETLSIVFFLPPKLFVPWLANPIAAMAVIALVYGKMMTSLALSFVSMMAGCSIVFMLEPGTRVGSGFFVWQGSFAILGLGAIAEMLIARRVPSE